MGLGARRGRGRVVDRAARLARAETFQTTLSRGARTPGGCHRGQLDLAGVGDRESDLEFSGVATGRQGRRGHHRLGGTRRHALYRGVETRRFGIGELV